MSQGAQQSEAFSRLRQAISEPLNLSKPKVEPPQAPENVKETLKSLIKSRRIAEGKEELKVDFIVVKQKCELTPEEKLKQKERKEQNRKAAMRCRERKKVELKLLQEEEDCQRQRQQGLKQRLDQLMKEKEKLLETIRSSGHICSCTDKCQNQTCIQSENLSSQINKISSNALHTETMMNNSRKSENSQSKTKSFRQTPRRCDDFSSESDSDSDDSEVLTIVMNSDSDTGEVLDLSYQNHSDIKEESGNSDDSLPCSSQESNTSQSFMWEKEYGDKNKFRYAAKRGICSPGVGSCSSQKYSKNGIDDKHSIKMEKIDQDFPPSSFESYQSNDTDTDNQPFSSQDSIDGQFLKHGGRVGGD